MACNIYSLVDFWLSELCRFHERKHKLDLSVKDIKAQNDFETYHKYLTKVASLSLQSVRVSHDHLNNLRKVRNCLIHAGSHVQQQQIAAIRQIPGIRVLDSGSLIVIADSFIWDSLDHAKTYLCAVAEA